jgi:hypothetical protein
MPLITIVAHLDLYLRTSNYSINFDLLILKVVCTSCIANLGSQSASMASWVPLTSPRLDIIVQDH